MVDITAVSAKFVDYKCFGANSSGFDRVLPINLIVGRNNSGKSTLLDLISFLAEPKPLDELGHQGRTPRAVLSVELRAEELKSVFSPDRRGGAINGSHWDYGRQWLGKEFSYTVMSSGALAFHSVTPPFKNIENGYADQLAREHGNPFTKYRFKRLDADRNVVAEPDSATRLSIPTARVRRISCSTSSTK